MKEFRDMLAEMFGEKGADQLIEMLEKTMEAKEECCNTKESCCAKPSTLMQYLEDFSAIDDEERKPFITESRMFRHHLGKLEEATREMITMTSDLLDFEDESQGKEVYRQLDLALAAMEDARMRFGKVIQYAEDGKSIYDK